MHFMCKRMICLFLIVLGGVSNFSYSMLMGYRFKKEPFYHPDTEVNIFSEVLFTYLQHELVKRGDNELVKEEIVIKELKDIFDEEGFLTSEQAFKQYSTLIDKSKKLKDAPTVKMVISWALVSKCTAQKYGQLKFNFVDFKRLMELTASIPKEIKICRGNDPISQGLKGIPLFMRWFGEGRARTVDVFLKEENRLLRLNVICLYYFLDTGTDDDKKNKEICKYICAAWQNRREQEGSLQEICWHEWVPDMLKNPYEEMSVKLLVEQQVELLKKRLELLPKGYAIAAFRTAYWLDFSQKEECVSCFEKECADHGIQVARYSFDGEACTRYLVSLK